MNNNNNVNKQKQQLSKELASLIEDYKNNLLKVKIYFKIEDKAIKKKVKRMKCLVARPEI
jgi:hypothetical protein